MHDPGTSRDKRDILDEIAKILNASCKWGEMTNRAAQICGKRNSPQLCAAGFLIKGDNSVALSKYVNELDFVHVKTLLKELCEKRGFLVLILPKYHCKLNPIEMIWPVKIPLSAISSFQKGGSSSPERGECSCSGYH